ncbi:MAG TPA: hypothetical protein VIG75_07570 [Citricoccus sp.]
MPHTHDHHDHPEDDGIQDPSERTGARPDEILADGAGPVSDEEAVLAYNANAEDGEPSPESPTQD